MKSKKNERNNIGPASFAVDTIHPSEVQNTPKIQREVANGLGRYPLEHKAESVADEVMHMPESSLVQRKCAHCEEEEQDQRKPSVPFIQKMGGNSGTHASDSVASKIQSTKGGGSLLHEGTKSFMESRFGSDFSHVRIHTDDDAVQMSRELNAQAFTVGKDIYFNEGKYQPDSQDGKHLLAHELTHTIQQGANNAPQVQRKIFIGASEMTIDEEYKKTVETTFGKRGLQIVLEMHNGGGNPEYRFKDWNAYSTEVRIRSNIIEGMQEVHNGCCQYPSSANPEGYLDPTYWQKKGDKHFEPVSPFPTGKESSDAIEAIFKSDAKTELECMTMAIAVEYYGVLKGVGKAKFNKMYPAGAGLVIANKGAAVLNTIINKDKFEEVTLTLSELIPGDYAYFKNFKDYGNKYPNGLWQGESVIYYGNGKFRGFGIDEMDAEGVLKELVKEYNSALPTNEHRTVMDLKMEGGGFTGYVYRPLVHEILK